MASPPAASPLTGGVLMRTKAFAAVLLVLVAVVVLSATRNTPVRDALLAKPSAAEAALDRVLPEVRFEWVPFDKAIELLETQSKARLLVDWPRLGNAGFDRRTPVSLC